MNRTTIATVHVHCGTCGPVRVEVEVEGRYWQLAMDSRRMEAARTYAESAHALAEHLDRITEAAS